MAKLLKLRRGTTSQHCSFTGAEGEVTVDTDKETLVVHDGSTAGGHAVAAEDMANVSSANIVGRLGTGSVVKAKLEADIIDSTKLADDAVNSEHYVDASIDHQHLSNDCIDGDNIQDDVINSEHYAAGSIDHEHLANDVIDGDNIQDDVINSEHIAAGAVDLEHMSSESVDEDNLKISNSGSNGQFLQKQSGNAGGLTWAAPDLSAYAPLAAPALTGTATAVNLTLSGNLTVNGTTTTVSSTNTTITDNLLELNSGASSNANDAGILIERGSTGDNAIIAWDESADKFTVGTTTAANDATGNISITTGTIVANVEGNVTGNVTGNTSGSSGSCTGNAATATDADTVDGIQGASLARSDIEETITGKFEFTSSGSYPLKINGSDDAKIILKGSAAPYIRWQENSTNKAYIKWETAGYLDIANEEANEILRIGSGSTGLKFSVDGTANTVWHSGNDGHGSGLDADTLDGVSSGSFLRGDTADTAGSDITFSGGAGAVTINAGSDIVFNNGNWCGDTYGAIQHHSDRLYIKGGTDGIRFREGGVDRWNIDGSGHLIPGADSSYNIGASGTRVSWAYFDNLNSTVLEDGKGDVRKTGHVSSSSQYTFSASNAGDTVLCSSGGWLLNTGFNSAGSGAMITIINNSGSDQTLTTSGVTLYNTADGSTGNRVLAGRGMATIYHAGGGYYYISGSGLS